jgi:hypothetical protein
LRDAILIPLLKLQYNALCFHYLGWRRLTIFLLKMPEYVRFVLLRLFTHNPPFAPKEKISGRRA